MDSQRGFGLFPEAKGYRWKLKLEAKGSAPEDLNDEPVQPPALPAPVISRNGEWLAAREAYARLTGLGYHRSVTTFRRWLSDAISSEQLPLELTKLGLQADFKTRRQANPKDDSVRWLRFDK